MGFPSEGIMSLYRNPMRHVVRFLHGRHAGNYRVYNLCIEAGYSYSPEKIRAQVVGLPLYDGQAPPLHLVHSFCKDAAAWLLAHPHNVVAVHCKAGKGRTGALICALLLYLAKHHPHLAPSELLPSAGGAGDAAQAAGQDTAASASQTPAASAAAASAAPAAAPVAATAVSASASLDHRQAAHRALPVLRLYGTRRTVDGRGLTISSQRRYVSYYATLLSTPQESLQPQSLLLCAARIRGLPQALTASGGGGGRGSEPLTVALWIRPSGDHEAKLLAYCHVGGKAHRSYPHASGGSNDGSSPAADGGAEAAAAEGGTPRATLQRQGSGRLAQLLCVQLPGGGRSRSKPLSHQCSASIDGSGTVVLEFVAAPRHPCAPAPAAASSAAEVELPPPAAGLPIEGDLKLQVFSGHIAPRNSAVFKGGSSLFLAWVNTAFGDAHDIHRACALNPGKEPQRQLQGGQQQQQQLVQEQEHKGQHGHAHQQQHHHYHVHAAGHGGHGQQRTAGAVHPEQQQQQQQQQQTQSSSDAAAAAGDALASAPAAELTSAPAAGVDPAASATAPPAAAGAADASCKGSRRRVQIVQGELDKVHKSLKRLAALGPQHQVCVELEYECWPLAN